MGKPKEEPNQLSVSPREVGNKLKPGTLEGGRDMAQWMRRATADCQARRAARAIRKISACKSQLLVRRRESSLIPLSTLYPVFNTILQRPTHHFRSYPCRTTAHRQTSKLQPSARARARICQTSSSLARRLFTSSISVSNTSRKTSHVEAVRSLLSFSSRSSTTCQSQPVRPQRQRM
eukprot:3503423-Rhodomonas_salina.1